MGDLPTKAAEFMGWVSFGDRWATARNHKSRVILKEKWRPDLNLEQAWMVFEKACDEVGGAMDVLIVPRKKTNEWQVAVFFRDKSPRVESRKTVAHALTLACIKKQKVISE